MSANLLGTTMEKSLHSAELDCKEPLLSKMVNKELIVKNEPLKEELLSELVKQEEVVEEEPYQYEIEAMLEDSNKGEISKNFNSQLLHSQVTSVQGLKDLVEIIPETRIVLLLVCQNDVGMQAPPDHHTATESNCLGGDVAPLCLLLEPAGAAPSNRPTRENPLTNNLHRRTLIGLSDEEKKEIFWCTTYARHPSFPKVGTTKRTRDIMLQRKILPEMKVFQINDRRFTSIHNEVLRQKTSITKNQLLGIEKEVSQFITQNENGNTQDTWNWDREKNLFLMECYFIDQALPEKAEKIEPLSLALQSGDIKANDFMVYLFQEKYKSPLLRNQILQQRHKILKIAKSQATFRKTQHTFPTEAELEKLEETACVKLKEMSFNHSFMEAVKDFNNKVLKCSDCDYKCNRKSDFRIHRLNHANIKQFRCSYCNYECNKKSHMELHVLTHSNIKQFRCSDCDYKCNRKSHLKQHMLIHSSIKRFKCSSCNYQCIQKNHLTQHMLAHSNIKLFKCSSPDCNYKSNQKSNLKTHMFTHSNIKHFRCSDCDYSCNVKLMLKRHVLTHFNTKLFKCSVCNYECNQKRHLKQHMLTH